MKILKPEAVMAALNQWNLRNKQNTVTSSAPASCSFETYPNYKNIQMMKTIGKQLNIQDPFFRVHDGLASATSSLQGEECINFSSYNYLNLSGDPRVSNAAINAIQHYGTSVSASRLVSGERPLHQQLEQALAALHGVDSALIFVSGHATNVTTIGYLFGPKDCVIHDDLIHNSTIEGIKLSGATKLSFPHNDWNTLDKILEKRRQQFERVLIVIEGHYSMDGDYPDLPQFIEVKNRHEALLMVDEAHSIGVLGKTGRGISELYGTNPKDVDIWMGTLSKALASCGGYIAGCHALIENLRYTAPGFLYSVGMAPPLAAAAFTALEIMLSEPERVSQLHERSTQFLTEAKKAGYAVGLSQGLGIIPILCGSSRKAIELSNRLYQKKINVQPIIYPAVPENQARLRFFINSTHTPEQISYTIDEL
ncbi:MAG: aminotransferase class I/II-fold pyridoxal phosphate-dependent enzyme [Gammaproteobacteria bacterium]|nr:aminotransferase class I/II-fold pyridoxal phosphate-dependent enzyme [Gammaproteobacteria bacterium]